MGMRIRAVSDQPQLAVKVQEKSDSSGQFQKQMNQQEKQQKQEEEVLTEEEKQKRLQAAIEEFTAGGLSATPTGTGPGLKVILKDGSGAVIRQMTGEEFLELRETAKGDGRARGKILDQKF